MSAKASTSERMSRTLVQLARRKGRLPALVTALAIGIYLVIKQVLFILLGWFVGSGLATITPQQNVAGLYELDDYSGPYFGQIPQQLLVVVLPFCLGVFLALWLIAPLAEQLTLAFVLTRGALAAAAGGILVLVVNFFVALVGAFSSGTWYFDGVGFLQGALNAVSTGAGTFIGEVIVVLFASVLLWLWLKEHPREYTVSGLIDEV